jgi:uncharacterized protein (TIGR03083 family)
MDEEAVWRVIDQQRLTVAELLAQLSEDEWRRSSLCTGWTVRDVAGHLAWQQLTSLPALLVDAVRARGNMDRTIHDGSCRWAARPTGQLIEEIRSLVGRRRRPPRLTYLEVLVDILVHGMDIAVPLGRPLEIPTEAAAVAADRIWYEDRYFGARTRWAGYRLAATDTSWWVGQGSPIEGPMDALLLLMTGRNQAAAVRLTGV